MDSKSIRLTETVVKGGCAAKLPAGELSKFLSSTKIKRPPELVVGTEFLDDACLWDLKDGRYLVQTLDFFTPIVDEAYDFGAIAAANSLSDVYAMGGSPLTALTILAFPSQHLPMELLTPLMKGAIEKIEESGACLSGGHSIDDETLKLGFSVTGMVDRDRVWKNQGAKSGDILVLTKGIGTGTITTALKIREADENWTQAAIASMKLLNRAPELLKSVKVNAATDVTGFGLAGHALQMARASQVSFEINLERVPAISGAIECIENEMLNRAHRTNLSYVEKCVQYEGIPEKLRWLSVDPQTSGGLLLSIPEDEAQCAVEQLKAHFPRTTPIGRVMGKNPEKDIIFKC